MDRFHVVSEDFKSGETPSGRGEKFLSGKSLMARNCFVN